jgi:hypothetical protein
MFQRELLTVGALAAAIFLAVAGAGWFTVRELHEYSSKLVEDTLPVWWTPGWRGNGCMTTGTRCAKCSFRTPPPNARR